jgi:hypothetical protein
VIRCVGRIATIGALCCAIGLHWVALQSIAWTTMIVSYAKQQSLRTAIVLTLDGAHPCSLCHAVSKGGNSEKKSALQSPAPKIDMICASSMVGLILPFIRFEYAMRDFYSSQIGRSPPVPPPRLLLG